LDWPPSVTGKLREQIQVIRAFWDCWQNDAPLNFRGEYYKITLMSPFFNPGKLPYPAPANPIPIYIAGVNSGLARLAGEVCDGFFVHPFHTPMYLNENLLPAIANGAEKTGREAGQVTISASVFVATNPAEQEACRQQISFYASTPSYRAVLALHGWEQTGEELSALAARGKWAEMPALISDEMLEAFVTQAETPAGLASALRHRYHTLADRLTLYTPFVPGEKDAWWQELLRHMAEA
jgi:probable F420-dependent oxidoreductase